MTVWKKLACLLTMLTLATSLAACESPVEPGETESEQEAEQMEENLGDKVRGADEDIQGSEDRVRDAEEEAEEGEEGDDDD